MVGKTQCVRRIIEEWKLKSSDTMKKEVCIVTKTPLQALQEKHDLIVQYGASRGIWLIDPKEPS
jgi:hypothetical protein